MRVLLRHSETGRYFQDLNQWTLDPCSARTFAQSGQAIQIAYGSHLTKMEVLLVFENPTYNVRLPIRDP